MSSAMRRSLRARKFPRPPSLRTAEAPPTHDPETTPSMPRTPLVLLALSLALMLVPAAHAAAPDDTYWALQWGPQQIRADEAWATSTGAGQTIAIVDSGIDLDHPDLASKIAGGATFAGCATQPGGCGNGDWQSGGPGVGAGDPHGTHVAGNDFASICGTPSSETGALCVAATDRNENRASYSNFAIKKDLDTVSAPGGAALLACQDDIVSTFPIRPADQRGFCETSENTLGYDFLAGTSMATPHVAGVAALLTAQGRGQQEVRDVLKATARTPVANTRGTYTPAYGFGIVDAAAAVAAP